MFTYKQPNVRTPSEGLFAEVTPGTNYYVTQDPGKKQAARACPGTQEAQVGESQV